MTIKPQAAAGSRIARHRRGLKEAGARRLEVVVPAPDAGLLRSIASTLRRGGAPARRLRAALAPVLAADPPRTGADLLAFFRSSPLVGEDLVIDRDRSSGRKIEL